MKNALDRALRSCEKTGKEKQPRKFLDGFQENRGRTRALRRVPWVQGAPGGEGKQRLGVWKGDVLWAQE